MSLTAVIKRWIYRLCIGLFSLGFFVLVVVVVVIIIIVSMHMCVRMCDV